MKDKEQEPVSLPTDPAEAKRTLEGFISKGWRVTPVQPGVVIVDKGKNESRPTGTKIRLED